MGKPLRATPCASSPSPPTQQQGDQRTRRDPTLIHSRPSKSRLPPLAQYSVGTVAQIWIGADKLDSEPDLFRRGPWIGGRALRAVHEPIKAHAHLIQLRFGSRTARMHPSYEYMIYLKVVHVFVRPPSLGSLTFEGDPQHRRTPSVIRQANDRSVRCVPVVDGKLSSFFRSSRRESVATQRDRPSSSGHRRHALRILPGSRGAVTCRCGFSAMP